MRRLLPLLMMLASCSQGPQADLPTIGEARSLVAEWAIINQLANEGKLTAPYTASMRKQLRERLQSCASSLTGPGSSYGKEVRASLREPDNASSATLREHAERLKAMEAALESA